MKTRSFFKFFFGTAGVALFNACEPQVMYGTPWVDFELKGHVADEDGQSVEGAVVSVIEFRNEVNQIESVQKDFPFDITVVSDADGKFATVKEEFYAPKHIRLECVDPSGKYEAMTQWAEAEQVKKGEGWYGGKYTYKSDFILKKIEK